MTLTMLRTAAAHAIVAVILQTILAAWIGWVGGGVAGVAFYLGREITQHEYKGGSWSKDLPWHYGLTHHWTMDSVMDITAPIVVVTTVALILL